MSLSVIPVLSGKPKPRNFMHIDIMFMSKTSAYLVAVEATVDYIMAYKIGNKDNITQQLEMMLYHPCYQFYMP